MISRRTLLRYCSLIVFFVFVVAAFAFVNTVLAATTPSFRAPELNVPIPGLDFKDHPIVVTADHTAKIPFLSAYIGAAYKYLLGVSVIAAAIMIVWGGFKYILGSVSDAQDGKNIIKDAIIGLVLIFGSFTILATLNPVSLTELKPLEVYWVEGDPYIAAVMHSSVTTKEPTSVDGSGSYSLSGECPIALPAPPAGEKVSKERSIAFHEKAIELTQGGTYIERLKKAADLAVQCNVTFGPCGNDIMSIWALAGIGNNACLTKYGMCYIPNDYKTIRSYMSNEAVVPVAQADLWGLHCNNDCSKKPNADMKAKANRADCVADKSGAVKKAQELLTDKIPEYPDKYSNLLQPGDWIFYYNANLDCAGTHSVMFLEWINETQGIAKVVGGDFRTNIHYSQLCLKKACGKWYPLVLINRPKK